MTKKVTLHLPELTVFVLVAILTYSSLQQFVVPDDFLWHVVMGQDFVEQGLGGLVDTHSFTMPGEKYKYVSWIYQILSYAFYSQFGGMLGLQVFLIVLWLLPLTILFIFFKNRKTHWAIQIISYLYFGYAAVVFYCPKPELIAYTANLLLLIFVLKYRSVWSPKAIVVAIAGLALWGNFHTSNVFGFIILGAFFFEWLIRFYSERKVLSPPWLQFSVLAISTFLVGFLNPTFQHSLILITHALGEWKSYISEYKSISISETPLAALVFIPVLCLTIYSCFKKQAWSICLILVFMLIESLSMLKMRYHLIIMTLPILDFVFKDWEAMIAQVRVRKGFRFATFILFAVFVIAPIHAIWVSMRSTPIGSALSNSEFATDVLQHMSRHGLTGKVFASYNLSSSVMLQLKKSLIYIDGRSGLLYPATLLERSHEVRTPVAFREEIKKYGIDFSLLEKASFVSVDLREYQNIFQPIYVGENHVLLTTHELGEMLPLQQIYYSPECFKLINAQNLEAQERAAYAKGLLAPNSVFANLQTLINLYFHNFKETLSPSFFSVADELLNHEDGLRRLGVYWSMQAGNLSVASRYLSQIHMPTIYDQIQAASINIEQGHVQEAANQLMAMIQTGVSPNYANQVTELLTKLRKKTGSALVPDDTYERFIQAATTQSDTKTNICSQ